MNIMILGRTLPTVKTGSLGLFEFEQARELNNFDYNIVYAFIDNRSVKLLKKARFEEGTLKKVSYMGSYLPIGGLPKKLFDKVKFFLFKKLYRKAVQNYGKIDLIHIHFPLITTNNLIIQFLKDEGVRIIVTEHWTKVLLGELTNREKKIQQKVLQCAEVEIVVSQELKKSIENMFPEYSDKLVVIPNLISSKFSFIEKTTRNYKSFGTIGRLTKVKQNNQVIYAISELIKADYDCRLYIIGDGEDREALEKLVAQLGMGDYVYFTGSLSSSKIAKIFSEIDVYVTASKIETFGVPVAESWLAGRPVVIPSNHPMSMFVNTSNGVIFNEGNLTSLQGALAQVLIKNYDLRKISESAKKSFDREVVVDKIKKIYGIL